MADNPFSEMAESFEKLGGDIYNKSVQKLGDLWAEGTQEYTDALRNAGFSPVTQDDIDATEASYYNPLNSKKYLVNNLIFPGELGTAKYHHYMMIFINETKFHASSNPLKEASDGYETAPNVLEKVDSRANMHNRLSMTDKETPGQLYRPTRRLTTAIGLYMPANIDVSYSNDWGNVETGIIGDLFQDALLNPNQDMETKMKTALNSFAQHLFKDVLKNGIGNILGTNADFYSPVSLATRAATNPHSEILYNGPKFRRFSFSWRLNPKNERETILIRNIIKTLKFYSSPQVNKDGKGGRYFIYPAEFDIAFYSGKDENPFISKISTCALTNISVSYGSNNGSFVSLRNGSPTQTILKLDFTELELMTKERILENF